MGWCDVIIDLRISSQDDRQDGPVHGVEEDLSYVVLAHRILEAKVEFVIPFDHVPALGFLPWTPATATTGAEHIHLQINK